MTVLTDPREPLHPLTVEDYHRMVEVGILTEDDRVELLEGVLFEMSPEGPSHAAVVDRLAWWLIRGLADDLRAVRIGSPVTLSRLSEPQPDFAVVERVDSNFTAHPTRAHLIIEVSKTSLPKDRARKARIYAEAGLPLYWIVDLVHREVVVHCDPGRTGYRDVTTVAATGMLDPGVCDLPPLDLDALFAED